MRPAAELITLARQVLKSSVRRPVFEGHELAAEVLRLHEWADGMTDAVLKERRLADARIKELRAALLSPPEAARIEIKAIGFIKMLREQRDRLADVLRWMDGKGGLGSDVHAEIRKALAGIPSYEEQLRNVCDGLGISVEELQAALARAPSPQGTT